MLLASWLIGCGEREQPAAIEPIWRTGTAQHFALDLRSQYGTAAGPAVFEFAMTARVTLEPGLQEQGNLDFLLAMDELQLNAQRSGAAADVALGAQQLARPAIFRLAHGQLADVWVEPGADPMVINIVRTVASALQHVPGGGLRWRASERDATGSYDVEYQVVSPHQVTRTKVRYLRWYASNTKASEQLGTKLQLPEVTGSTLHVMLDDRGEVTEVTLDETLAMSLGMRSLTRMTLKRASAGVAIAQKLPTLRARLKHYGADDPAVSETLSSGKQVAAAMDEAKAASVPFDALVSKLEAQARGQSGARPGAEALPGEESEGGEAEELSSDEAAAFSVLSASLRARPENIGKAEKLITAGSSAAPRLISGLGAAGSPTAHEALLRLMDDQALPEKLRTRCGVALLRTPTPSPAAVSGVAAKLDTADWHRLAVYGLGTYSRRLREAGDLQEARRLTSLLTERLARADNPSERADLLRGLSNAAAPEAFAAIRPYVDSKSPEIRSGALTALRLIEHADVDVILAAALSSDVQVAVRLAALRAIADRAPSPTLSEAIARALTRDDSTRIRYEAIELATKWPQVPPQLREALSHAAAHDAEAAIRQRATAAVKETKTASR